GATRFLKPQYSAQAKIWIDVEGRRGPERGPTPIRSGQLLDAESWVDLLESYVVLDQVVRDQRLYVSPNAPADAQAVAKLGVADQFQAGAYRFTVDHSGQGYTLATADGVELERGTLGDSVGSRYGLRWVPDASTVGPGRLARSRRGIPCSAASSTCRSPGNRHGAIGTLWTGCWRRPVTRGCRPRHCRWSGWSRRTLS